MKRIGAIERLNVEKYGNKDFYKEETPEDIEERITEILEITKMVISEKRKELNLLTHESGTYPNDNELLNKLIIDKHGKKHKINNTEKTILKKMIYFHYVP